VGLGVLPPAAVATPPPTVQFDAATYAVLESAPTATITVRRRGSTAAGQSVVVRTTTAGTAAAGEFVPLHQVVTFARNQATATVTLRLSAANETIDGDRTVVLELLSPTSPLTLGPRRTATLTIREDDSELRFGSAEYAVTEGGAAVLTVLRVGATLTPATVRYATEDGTATAGRDFAASSRELTFRPGVASQAITIQTVDDPLPEGNESFTVTLTQAVGAVVGSPGRATVTIVDDDLPGTVQFGAPTYVVVEGGVATITVTRTGGLAGPITVGFATVAGGTATGGGAAAPGVDYLTRSGTLTFAAGDTEQTFTVQTVQDTVREEAETVNLALSVPPGSAAVLGAPPTATLTILDDD
jgi:hypothetical protein